MHFNIVVDSGFWFALFTKSDKHHIQALSIEKNLLKDGLFNLLIPWPTLYETINTKFVKKRDILPKFQYYINHPKSLKIDDEFYKNKMIEMVLNPKKGEDFSAVDWIIRDILADRNIKTDALITFNERDFIDLCCKYNIEIITD